MFDHISEITRINNMDEKQILLKVRNLKKFAFMTKEQFNDIQKAVISKLDIYGYELTPSCCGRYNATKRIKE